MPERFIFTLPAMGKASAKQLVMTWAMVPVRKTNVAESIYQAPLLLQPKLRLQF